MNVCDQIGVCVGGGESGCDCSGVDQVGVCVIRPRVCSYYHVCAVIATCVQYLPRVCSYYHVCVISTTLCILFFVHSAHHTCVLLI